MRRVIVAVMIILAAMIAGNMSTAMALRFDPQYTPLMKACAAGDIGLIIRLIENGADVNERNKFGYTPLSVSCEAERLNVIKLLLERGANPNARTRGGYSTVLMRACVRANAELVRMLVEHGANINERDQRGSTALAHLTKGGLRRLSKKHKAIIRYLKDHGAIE